MRAAIKSSNDSPLLFALLALTGFLGLALVPATYVGVVGDDASFILGAQSLLGGHWRALCIPGHPPMAHFLPGYSLMLTPFVALVRPHWALLPLATVALLLGAVTLLWVFLADAPRAVRWGACAIFAAHPILLANAPYVMADPWLLFLSLAAVVAFKRSVASRESMGAVVGMACALAWAALSKPIGLALWIGIACAALAIRAGRRVWIALGVSALFIGGFYAASLHRVQTPTNYVDYLAGAVRALDPSFGGGLLRIKWAAANVLVAAIWVHPGGLASMTVVTVLMGAGLLWHLKSAEPQRAAAFAAAINVTLCGVVLSVWTLITGRYILPLLPFLLMFLLTGVYALSGRYAARATAAVSVALFAIYVAHDARLLRDVYGAGHPMRETPPTATLEWIRHQTPPTSVFLGEAPLIYLYTGRQGYGVSPLLDADMFRYYVLHNGMTHLFWRPRRLQSLSGALAIDHQRQEDLARTWALQHPQWFPTVYQNAGEHTIIQAVRPDPAFVTAYTRYLARMVQGKELDR